jgi:eukaryotic-like serine/threonine-protein kinase
VSTPTGRRAGSKLGPYELAERIGTGGMGEVYRARDPRLDRDVALKLLPEEFAVDRNRLKRFEQEARVVSTLSHPNIVTVFEIGEADSVSYIAMELVRGQTLRQVLRPGGLPFRKLLELAVQMAEGLSRAHEAGIVHRDLKPENVMVTPDGIVKILDFGLAKLTRSPLERGAGPDEGTLPLPTQPGVLLGTVRYMSPEQAGGAVADFRADQFSFGSVLYEMATGQPPFQKATTVDTLSAILHDDPEPLSQASPKTPAPLRWIIERCLAKDAKDRYAATRDLAHDLANLQQHLSEVSLSGVEPAPRLSRRRARAAAMAALLAAVVFGAGLLADRWIRQAPDVSFRQLTFRGAGISTARFAPDGRTVVYSAQWEGLRPELFETRVENPESRSMGLPAAHILSISSEGMMAILLLPAWGVSLRPPHSDITVRDPYLLFGTLALVPLGGGTPREVLEDVDYADWAPDGKNLAVERIVKGENRLEFPIGTVLFRDRSWLNDVRVSPRGDRVLFTDAGEYLKVADRKGAVQDFDLDTPSVAWSPRSGEIWYGAVDRGTTRIRGLQPGGGDRLVAPLAGDFVIFDISASGRVLLGRVVESAEVFESVSGEAHDRNLSNFDRSMLASASASGDEVIFKEVGMAGGLKRPVLYLRRSDGFPPKRLGNFEGGPLSPDGKQVLVLLDDGLALVPTGAGQPVPVPVPGLQCCGMSGFFPDGKSIFFVAEQPDRPKRVWAQDLETGKRRPLTPEGVRRPTLSLDGRYLCGVDDSGSWNVYPTQAGEPRKVAGILRGEEPFQWTGDGRLYVRGSDETRPGEPAIVARVFRVDPWTGRRELWKEIAPISPTTGGGIGTILFSADGRICFYNHHRYSSELFLADGLR